MASTCNPCETSLKAECAQWQKLHAQEAARARQLEAELQLLRSASSASKQPAEHGLVAGPPGAGETGPSV